MTPFLQAIREALLLRTVSCVRRAVHTVRRNLVIDLEDGTSVWIHIWPEDSMILIPIIIYPAVIINIELGDLDISFTLESGDKVQIVSSTYNPDDFLLSLNIYKNA